MERYPLHFVTRLLTGLLILACAVLMLRSLAVPIVTAGSVTMNVGDIFVIPVSISGVDPAEPISSWQFDLTFGNTSVIRVCILSLVLLAAVPALAQATAPGPYYATPSWDQTLPANTRFIGLLNFNSAFSEACLSFVALWRGGQHHETRQNHESR